MKKLSIILPLALILCFMVGCQDKAAMTELEKFKAQAAVEEQNKEAILRMIKLADEGNTVEALKFYSPNCVFHSGGIDYSLDAYLKERAAKFSTAFPGYQHHLENVIPDGDKVVVYMICSGTHKGDFMGLAPTGKTVKWPVIAIYSLASGIIEDVWVELDVLSLMQQLGMELRPKEEN